MHSSDSFVARGCGVSLLTTAAGLPNESCHQALDVCQRVGGSGVCEVCIAMLWKYRPLNPVVWIHGDPVRHGFSAQRLFQYLNPHKLVHVLWEDYEKLTTQAFPSSLHVVMHRRDAVGRNRTEKCDLTITPTENRSLYSTYVEILRTF